MAVDGMAEKLSPSWIVWYVWYVTPYHMVRHYDNGLNEQEGSSGKTCLLLHTSSSYIDQSRCIYNSYFLHLKRQLNTKKSCHDWIIAEVA